MIKSTVLGPSVRREVSKYFPNNGEGKTAYRLTDDGENAAHKLGQFQPIIQLIEPMDNKIVDDSAVWMYTANKYLDLLIVVHENAVYRIDTLVPLIRLMIDRPKEFSTTATMENGVLTLHIAVADIALDSPLDGVVSTRRREIIRVLSAILPKHLLTPVSRDHGSDSENDAAADKLATFYEHVKNVRSETVENVANIVDDRLPSLRQYQQQTIAWMLDREHGESDDLIETWLKETYVPLVGDVLINKYTGHFAHKERIAEQCRAYIKGGVLAEEMGLGKTVETLAVCLLHPRPAAELPPPVVATKRRKKEPKAPRSIDVDVFCVCQKKTTDDLIRCVVCERSQHKKCVNWKEKYDEATYNCPQCAMETDKPHIRGTLVISPESIVKQWSDEVARHVHDDNFSVMIYDGVKASGYVQQQELAAYDLVICSYETLRTELNYVNCAKSAVATKNRLRHERRYINPSSPIVTVEWWRVCIDEAQLVENASSKAAQMCHQLSAVNRWLVTGTPLTQSLYELPGLLSCIGTLAYTNKKQMTKSLIEPYCRGDVRLLAQVMAKLMRRTMKSDVKEQLAIPPLTVIVTSVQLTAPETEVMRQLQARMQVQLPAAFNRFVRHAAEGQVGDGAQIENLDSRTISVVTHMLLQLRKSCVHSSLVQSDNKKNAHKFLTMRETMVRMVADTRRRCVDAQRGVMITRNGLAGLAMLDGDRARAREMYTTTIARSEKLMEKISIDSLPLIHACHHLIPLLDDDDAQRARLREKVDARRVQFLGDPITALREVHEKYVENEFVVDEVASLWFVDIARQLTAKDEERAVESIMTAVGQVPGSTARHMTQLTGVCQYVSAHLENVREANAMCETSIQQLLLHRDALSTIKHGGDDVLEIVKESELCHLRPIGEPLNSCTLCVADTLIEEYQRVIGLDVNKTEVAAEHDEHLSRQEATAARKAKAAVVNALKAARVKHHTALAILRSMLHLANTSLGVDADTKKNMIAQIEQLSDGHAHRAILLQQVRGAIAQLAANHDELAIAFLRMELVPHIEGEERQGNQVYQWEIGPRQVEQRLLLAEQEQTLRARLGRLTYTLHLQRQGETAPRSEEEAMTYCLICMEDEPLSVRTMVMLPQCGHWLCVKCFQLEKRHRVEAKTILCAQCRVPAVIADVVYMCNKGKEVDEGGVKIEGHEMLSSKMSAIMKSLMNVLEGTELVADPNVPTTSTAPIVVKKETARVPKVIVFSQWDAVLNNLADVLVRNRIAHSNCAGQAGRKMATAIQRWRDEPNVNVLLLPLHCGARGLNLTEGEHVFFVEPIMNAAAESQAIARVHRMSQTRHMYVHKFIVENSVESIIHSRGVKNGEVPETAISGVVSSSLPLNLSVHELHTMFTVDYCMS